MTQEQFTAFMVAQAQQTEQLLAAARQGAAGAGGAGAAAAVGQLQPCVLGRDKTKRYFKWNNWLKDAKTKMNYLAITQNTQKLAYVRSQAGAELLTFWEKEVRARWEGVPANVVLGTDAIDAHTFNELIAETERVLLEIVNRDRAVIDLFRMEQGSRSFMDYLSEVEDQSLLCTTREPLTNDDLKRISLLAGIKDRSLVEKAMADRLRPAVADAASPHQTAAVGVCPGRPGPAGARAGAGQGP